MFSQHRYHVLGVFLLMMMTSGVVLAEDDEEESPGSRNISAIDVSLIPGFRILLSADDKKGSVLRLALRPHPEEGSFLAPRNALLGIIYFSIIDRYLWRAFFFALFLSCHLMYLCIL